MACDDDVNEFVQAAIKVSGQHCGAMGEGDLLDSTQQGLMVNCDDMRKINNGEIIVANENLLKGKKVLIVDDEPDVLETLEDLLAECQVTKAASFETAAKMIQTQTFDLLILDIMGVDGYKLLDIASEKKLTAVMLTAHALSPENTKLSYQKGAAYYLPKEEMIHITDHLNDVLTAQKEGKTTWFNWLNKFASFYDKKFGADWQDEDKDFWDKFKYYY